MMPALNMPVEKTKSTLGYQTQWMYLDCEDNSSQSKTMAVLQGMEPVLQNDQENFILRWWECTVYTVDLVSSVLIP